METSLQHTERTYLRLILWSLGSLIIFVLLCWGGFRFYRHWQEGHLLRRAAAVLSGGDLKTASLNARRVLQLNPANTDAMRLLADIAEKGGERNAVDWLRKVVQARPDSVDDALALARSAVRVKDFGSAAKTLEGLGERARDKPEFYATWARLAEARKDLAAAESHWAKAVDLAPEESGHRLQLAIIRLGLVDPAKRQSALGALEELRADPKQRTAALRTLVLDGLEHGKDSQRALALAKELEDHPDAGFGDRILYLELLRQNLDPAYEEYLARLKSTAPTKPADLAALLSWLIRNHKTAEAIEFTKDLPPELVSKWPVPLAIAEAYAQSKSWPELERMTRNSTWSSYEFLRRAYLARALRGQDKTLAAEQELSAAQKEAAINPKMLSMLTKTVAEWGWQGEAVELLWALTKSAETKALALQTLYEHYMRSADTPGLYRALAKLAELNPQDSAVQNNLAQVSLLLGVDTDHARRSAAELAAKDPSNPAYASTYAFALLTKGDIKGALNAMNRLSGDQLRDPSVSIYYGLVLTAAGEKEQAREFLVRSWEATLLPEEKALVAKAASGAN